MFAQSGPRPVELSQTCPNVAALEPKRAGFGQTRRVRRNSPKLGRTWPTWGRSGSMSDDFGPHVPPDLGQHRPESGPGSAEIGPRLRPKSPKIWPASANIGPKSANVGPISARLREPGPSSVSKATLKAGGGPRTPPHHRQQELSYCLFEALQKCRDLRAVPAPRHRKRSGVKGVACSSRIGTTL